MQITAHPSGYDNSLNAKSEILTLKPLLELVQLPQLSRKDRGRARASEREREREKRERERESEQTSKRAEGGEGGNCAHAPCSPQPRYSMKDTAASVFVASWSGTNARNSQSYMHEAASASSMEAWHWKKRSKSVGMQSCIAVKDCSIHETQRNS